MARGSVQIHARLQGAAAAKQEADSMDRRLDGAVRDFVDEATTQLRHQAIAGIEQIAGGVYWDVNVQVSPTPHGAIGRVSTPASRPHPIDPIPPNTHLRFFIPGVGWRSPKHVDHPGSNPVDWTEKIGGFAESAERTLERHVGRVLGSV